MKQILFSLIVTSTVFCSCTNGDNKVSATQETLKADSTKGNIEIDMTAKAEILKDSIEKASTNNLQNRMLGIWASMGDDNATFIIEKNKIVYPDVPGSYKYTLTKDSIRIKYDDYQGVYLVRMPNVDTLVMTGDEEQTYYRFKD